MRGPRGRRAILAVLAMSAAAVACTDDTGSGPPATSTSVAARPTTTMVTDDGVLRIGALLPRTGSGARLGEPLLQAVQLAVDEINAVGGVNGRLVELVVADEGDTNATATKGAAELVDARVDAVVGPASSRLSLAVLGTFVDAGVFTCSPTATALALTAFPDERMFVRSIASDGLQAIAMAGLIEGAGIRSAAVMAPDDGYGRPYVQALVQSLTRRGITVRAEVLYKVADDDYADDVASLLSAEPGAVALVGNSVTGRQVLAALDEQAPEGFTVVVNDALRRASAVDAGAPVTGNADIVGASPRPGAAPGATQWFNPALATRLGLDPAELPLSFAANAYDCVSLIAVSAALARNTQATAIAANVRDASAGGASCGNYATCLGFIDQGRNIDLNGASGPLELDVDGDVSVAWFDRFRFDEEGRDVSTGDILVGS